MENLTKLNYVSQAENVILSLREKDKWGNETIRITSTKLRNMLTMSSGLYNKLLKNRAEKLSEDLQSDIQYLRMRFAYESGRDRDVDFFVKRADLIGHIDKIGESRENALLFCRYMESLIAYHKFYGGRDR